MQRVMQRRYAMSTNRTSHIKWTCPSEYGTGDHVGHHWSVGQGDIFRVMDSGSMVIRSMTHGPTDRPFSTGLVQLLGLELRYLWLILFVGKGEKAQ